MLLLGFAFNFIYIISFATVDRLKKMPDVFVIGILCISLFEIFSAIMVNTGWLVIFPHLFRLNTPFVFLLGPILYFWIVFLGNANFRFQRKHLLHLIPFLLCILVLAPVYVLNAESKIAYINSFIEELPIHSLIIGGARRIQQLLYLLLIFLYLKNSFRKSDLKNWRKNHFIWSVTILFLLLWIIDIYRYFFNFDLQGGYINVLLLSIFSVYLVYRNLKNLNSESKPIVRRKSLLDSELRASYRTRLVLSLEKDKVYLDQNLTLPTLSEKLNVPLHYLSEVINEDLKTNFKALLNQYRVKEAMSLLNDENLSHLKIEALAYQAGFKSTSSFNSNFKLITGKTPKEFRGETSA